MALPDYRDGSIVNLMSSFIHAGDGVSPLYPALANLDPLVLREHRNMFLLVLDGLGYEFLMQRERGALRQHLKGRLTSVFPSTTASAITTYLTGDAPQQHAITGWFMYFRELGAVMTVLRAAPRFGGVDLSHSGVDAKRLFGHVPISVRMGVPTYLVTPRDIAYSDFNMAHKGSAEVHIYKTLSQMFATTAAITRARHKRKFIYCYWPGLDHTGHVHGIGSRQAIKHYQDIDAAFGEFLDSIKGSGTVVVVTADHGLIDVTDADSIELDDHPDLAETLALPLCGERRVAYCYVRPDRRQAFEQYVTAELEKHAEIWSSDELIDNGYFGVGAPHPRLRERVGDYTLIMKQRFVIKDWLLGEPRHVQIGVHGGTSDAEMYVPLIVATA
jgi:predicted AlkP superfamily pyrophosphatase or phosphodiesterase